MTVSSEDYDKAVSYIVNGLDEALAYLQEKYPNESRDHLIKICKEIAEGMWY